MGLAEKKTTDTGTELEVVKTTPALAAAVPEEDEMEIDLLDLAYVLLDKIHYIILCLLAGAVILNAFSSPNASPGVTSAPVFSSSFLQNSYEGISKE